MLGVGTDMAAMEQAGALGVPPGAAAVGGGSRRCVAALADGSGATTGAALLWWNRGRGSKKEDVRRGSITRIERPPSDRSDGYPGG